MLLCDAHSMEKGGGESDDVTLQTDNEVVFCVRRGEAFLVG